MSMTDRPTHVDLQREHGLSLTWADGSIDFIPIPFLRKMSPSAEARQLREELAVNRLAVLPSSGASSASGPLRAVDAELVGGYALRVRFSDGHHTGIYSWAYLRDLAAQWRSMNPQSPAAN